MNGGATHVCCVAACAVGIDPGGSRRQGEDTVRLMRRDGSPTTSSQQGQGKEHGSMQPNAGQATPTP